MDVGKEVGEKGQKLISHFVPEISDLSRGVHKARTIYRFSFSIDQRLYDQRIIFRIIFKISILNDHIIFGRFGKTADDRRSFAMIFFLLKQLYSTVIFELLQFLPTFVFGSVINYQQFTDFRPRKNHFNDFADGRFFIVNRHHHRE